VQLGSLAAFVDAGQNGLAVAILGIVLEGFRAFLELVVGAVKA
jgi:hypothetical protein